MKLRLSILLLAAALAAAPAAGQTIKSLGYNTTNGQVVYSGTNALTFTNSLQFATNARAATRTNLGGTTVGDSVFTATNAAAAQVAIFGTNVIIKNSAKLEGLSLSDGQTKLLNAISFPYLGGSTAAATTRTNLGGTTVGNSVFTATNAAAAATAIGLGTTNDVTFNRIATTASGSFTNPAIRIGASNTGLISVAGFLYGVSRDEAVFAASPTGFTVVPPATFLTNVTISGNLSVGSLTTTTPSTFLTNVTVNGNLSVGSFTTTTPSTWALDATQTAAATNGILALPSNANVIRLTNNTAISGVSGGVLGAFYYLVNQTTNAVTISNVGGITVQGGTPLTLGANQSATLVATGATNASVAARGDLNDVALGGTANTAPSQTASSGASLMTRDLVDAAYTRNFNKYAVYESYNFTTSMLTAIGGSASPSATTGGVDSPSWTYRPNSTNDGANNYQALLGPYATLSTGARSTKNWSKKSTLAARIMHVASNGTSRYYWGPAAATWAGGSLAVKGIGFEIITNSIFAVCHNGTTKTTSASGVVLTNQHLYNLVSESDGTGNVRWWVNGAEQTALTNGPTGLSAAAAYGFVTEAVNPTPASGTFIVVKALQLISEL